MVTGPIPQPNVAQTPPPTPVPSSVSPIAPSVQQPVSPSRQPTTPPASPNVGTQFTNGTDVAQISTPSLQTNLRQAEPPQPDTANITPNFNGGTTEIDQPDAPETAGSPQSFSDDSESVPAQVETPASQSRTPQSPQSPVLEFSRGSTVDLFG